MKNDEEGQKMVDEEVGQQMVDPDPEEPTDEPTEYTSEQPVRDDNVQDDMEEHLGE